MTSIVSHMLRLITFKKKLAELLQKEDTIAAVTLTQFIEDQPHYLQTCQKDMNVDRSLLGKDSILFQKQLELEKEMKSQDIAKSDAETKANHRALLNEKFRASLKQHQAEQPDKFWSELPGLAGKIRSYFNVAPKINGSSSYVVGAFMYYITSSATEANCR